MAQRSHGAVVTELLFCFCVHLGEQTTTQISSMVLSRAITIKPPRNHMMLHTLYQNWLGLYRSRHHHRSTLLRGIIPYAQQTRTSVRATCLLDTIRNNHGPERNHLGMACTEYRHSLKKPSYSDKRNIGAQTKVLCILLPALASPRQICSRKTELFCKHLPKPLCAYSSLDSTHG